MAASDALTGKTILKNGAWGCHDPIITVTPPADEAEVMLLVRTADRDADPDLPDTQQRLIAYWDSVSPLPLPAVPSGGVSYSVLVSVSSGPDRLLKLGGPA